MVTAGYCIASFLVGALSALLIGLFIASRKREWIITNAKQKLF